MRGGGSEWRRSLAVSARHPIRRNANASIPSFTTIRVSVSRDCLILFLSHFSTRFVVVFVPSLDGFSSDCYLWLLLFSRLPIHLARYRRVPIRRRRSCSRCCYCCCLTHGEATRCFSSAFSLPTRLLLANQINHQTTWYLFTCRWIIDRWLVSVGLVCGFIWFPITSFGFWL